MNHETNLGFANHGIVDLTAIDLHDVRGIEAVN